MEMLEAGLERTTGKQLKEARSGEGEFQGELGVYPGLSGEVTSTGV